MAGRRPIPIPIKHRLRLIRLQWVPIIMFGAATLGVLLLMGRQTGIPMATGQVNAEQYAATSSAEGLMVEAGIEPLELFQPIRAGDILARLDDRPVRASLAVLQAESGRLRLEVAATRAAWEQANGRLLVDSQSEWHRRMLQVETLRLDALDRRTQLELDRVALQHEDARLAQAEEAHRGQAVTSLELTAIRVNRNVIAERIDYNSSAVEELEAQLSAARDRLSQFQPPDGDDLAAVLAPLQAAVTTQEARIEEVRIQIAGLVIRAPIDGLVTAIHRVPGQTVTPGEPVVSISAETGRYIVAYLRQGQRVLPAVGMPVVVRLKTRPQVKFETLVDRVGASYVLIPEAQRRDPTRPEWGLPVRIALRPDADLVPGELVDLTFDISGGI